MMGWWEGEKKVEKVQDKGLPGGGKREDVWERNTGECQVSPKSS